MKKKVVLVLTLFFMVGALAFAAPSKGKAKGGEGKDKIGGYIGYPIGLSYGHEFNDLVELDLVAGFSYYYYTSRLDIQVGALFTVFDPVVEGLGGKKCPLSIGPVIGGSFFFYNSSVYAESAGFGGGAIKILVPLRWEMNFGDVPNLNVFIDWSPLGLGIYMDRRYYSVESKIKPRVWYASRGGIGIRYRIPN